MCVKPANQRRTKIIGYLMLDQDLWLTDISLGSDVSLGLDPIWSVPDSGLDLTPIQDILDTPSQASWAQ
eukprot:4407873-Ditylum_brightwellii.AAC.1